MTKAALWALGVLGAAAVSVSWLGPRVEPIALALAGATLLAVAWVGSARQRRASETRQATEPPRAAITR